MGLLADALAESRTGRACPVPHMLETLSTEDQADFTEYVEAIRRKWVVSPSNSNGPSVTKLHAALTALGATVNEKRLATHVKGGCACGQDR